MAKESNKRVEKVNSLATLAATINKTHGSGAIFKMDESPITEIEKISTSSILLDEALGGGFGRGRIVEIFGFESSGKSTIAALVASMVQKSGGNAAIVDAEHAFDMQYAEQLGVEKSQMLMSQPDNGEQALDITLDLVEAGIVDVVIVDSVAALTPKAEIEGEMGDQQMGLQARLMSKACRKLTSAVNKSNCVLIFINQLREKIGVMFGNPNVTTGGNALKFYASQRVDIRKGAYINDTETGEPIGHKIHIKVIKNKIAPPFRKAEIDLIYGKGFSPEGEVLDIAIDTKIVDKSGSWFSYGDTKLGQGRAKVITLLEDNPELFEEIKAKINEKID